MNDSACENCAEWGETITLEENRQAVPCPRCGRLTWPNLGVNIPAGCAVALATGNAIWTVAAIEKFSGS